ncbi:unnamed protein product [Amoebophrya sp. A25]|nr:unnamed protein product [Amoebophrya sp. A25]|eukprot:GSA25T00024468001.1
MTSTSVDPPPPPPVDENGSSTSTALPGGLKVPRRMSAAESTADGISEPALEKGDKLSTMEGDDKQSSHYGGDKRSPDLAALESLVESSGSEDGRDDDKAKRLNNTTKKNIEGTHAALVDEDDDERDRILAGSKAGKDRAAKIDLSSSSSSGSNSKSKVLVEDGNYGPSAEEPQSSRNASPPARGAEQGRQSSSRGTANGKLLLGTAGPPPSSNGADRDNSSDDDDDDDAAHNHKDKRDAALHQQQNGVAVARNGHQHSNFEPNDDDEKNNGEQSHDPADHNVIHEEKDQDEHGDLDFAEPEEIVEEGHEASGTQQKAEEQASTSKASGGSGEGAKKVTLTPGSGRPGVTARPRPKGHVGQRERLVFGMLKGHLQSAKKDLEMNQSTELTRSKEIAERTKRAMDRMEVEKEKAEQERKAAEEKERFRQKRIKELKRRDEEVLALRSRLEEHYGRMRNFLRTKTEQGPVIFWLPRKHTKETQRQLELGQVEIDKKIESLKETFMLPSQLANLEDPFSSGEVDHIQLTSRSGSGGSGGPPQEEGEEDNSPSNDVVVARGGSIVLKSKRAADAGEEFEAKRGRRG